VANSADNYGVALRHLNRLAESADALRRCRDGRATLARDFPDLPEYRYQLAQAHSNLASVLTAAGRTDEASREMAAAVPLLERLTADFPASLEYRSQLASTYATRGGLALAAGRPADALTDYGRAAALIEGRADALLKSADNRKVLGLSYRTRGLALIALGRHAEAVAEFDRAIPYFLPAERHLTQIFRAKALARSAGPAAAARAADELARADGLSPRVWGGLAQVYAAAAELTKDDPARAEAYAARAVELIRTAIAHGLPRDAVAKDGELAPIRDRPDFRASVSAPAAAGP
jgi:tetratricopeptide (TPR) repeat protein